MENLSIERVAVTDIRQNSRNARTHSPRQISRIAESIRAFGFTNPVLIDENGVLIAGHGRLAAAIKLGLGHVPAIRISHLGDTEKRALMLADNKIALNAGWDLEILANELADLSMMELSFDVELTGFEVGEIDIVISEGADKSSEDADLVALPDPDAPAVTNLGDLWALGNHRILCGDARCSADMERLMGRKLADAGFTDPPYNVKINGHVSGGGRTRHREFAQASGEMSRREFTAFLSETLGHGTRYSRSGAVWFVCMDWRHMAELLAAGEVAFDRLLNLCVWAKTNGGMGSLYRSRHELVFVFRNGAKPHRNNVQLGRFGRNRTNVWEYAGVNTFREGRMEELAAHPTAKPVAMVKDALLDVTKRGDVVLDPFLGAGATLIAAERSGRIVRGMEIDPAYVDIVLRRWRKETGEEPVRVADKRTLASLEADHLSEAVS